MERESSASSSSSSSNSSSNSRANQGERPKRRTVTVAPDGGWGWMVLAATFCCNVMVDGNVYAFGMFMKVVPDDLGKRHGAVSLVGSLLQGFNLFVGPIVSIMCHKYGFRIVAIVGSVTACVGFASSFYANSIYVLYLTYGIIGGIGFGLISIPSSIVIGFYFDQWRALATCISVCGSSLGAGLIPPLVEMCISQYGWRVAILFQSALMLSCSLFALAFRPLEPVAIESEEGTNKEEPPVEKSEKQPLLEPPAASTSVVRLAKESSSQALIHAAWDRRQAAWGNGPSVWEDESYRWDPSNLHAYRTKSRGSRPVPAEHAVAAPAVAATTSHTPAHAAAKGWRQLVDTTLFASPTFRLLTASVALRSTVIYVPTVFLPDRARELGMSPMSQALLLTVVSGASTASRVACGVAVSGLNGLSSVTVTGVSLALGGAATALDGLFDSPAAQVVYCVVFGLAIGCFNSLHSIMIVDLLGLDRLTDAYGLSSLFQGLAMMVGPPLAGWLKHATNSYTGVFVFAGSVMMGSAALLAPLDWINVREKTANAAHG